MDAIREQTLGLTLSVEQHQRQTMLEPNALKMYIIKETNALINVKHSQKNKN